MTDQFNQGPFGQQGNPQHGQPQQAGQQHPQQGQPQYGNPQQPQYQQPQQGQPQQVQQAVNNQPQFQPVGAQDSGSSSNLGRLGLIGALAVLLIGGAAALTFGVFGGSDGGADSPVAAAETMFQAAADQDPLGALSVILPSDFEAFVEPNVAVLEELVRLGILDDAVVEDGGPSFGDAFQFEITESFAFESTPLFGGSDQVNSVTVTAGQLVVTFDEEALDELSGDFLDLSGDEIDEAFDEATENLGGEVPEDDEQVSEIETATITFEPTRVVSVDQDGIEDIMDEPFEIITAQQDGRHYIAPSYWIAELIRRDFGAAEPNLGNRLVPTGADSPEEALNQLAKAASEFDFERAISLMDPEEFGALYFYWDLLDQDVEEAERQAASLLSDAGATWSLDLQSRSVEREGRTVVIPNGVAFSLTTADFDASIDLDPTGGSFGVTAQGSALNGDIEVDNDAQTASGQVNGNVEGESVDVQFNADLEAQSGEVTGSIGQEEIDISFDFDGECFNISGTALGEPINEQECGFGTAQQTDQPDINAIFDDLETPGFNAVERDGRWFISGAPTLSYFYVDILRAISEDEVEELRGFFEDAVNAQLNGALANDSFFTEEDFSSEPFEEFDVPPTTDFGEFEFEDFEFSEEDFQFEFDEDDFEFEFNEDDFNFEDITEELERQDA